MPDFPIIPFIEGDGIGIDVTPVMLDVVNAAVEKAYGEKRAIRWMQVYAGQAAADLYGDDTFMPDETLHALQGVHRFDQRPAGNAHGRRDSFSECRHSADDGSVRLCAANQVLSRVCRRRCCSPISST